VDIEQGLHSIPEIDDIDLPPEDLIAEQRARSMEPKPKRRRSRSQTPARERSRFSIGGTLGSIVNLTFRGSAAVVTLFLHLLTNVLFLLGRVFGTMFDVVFNRPYLWVKSSRAKGLATFAKYILLAFTLVSAWFILRSPTAQSYIPKLSFPSSSTRHSPVYTAPDVPAANIVELAERLQRIENALSGLSVDSERTKAKADDGVRGYHDLMSRLGVLETKLSAESRKIVDAEMRVRDVAGRGLSGVKQDVEVLQAQIIAQQKLSEKEREEKEREKGQGHGHGQGHSSDEEARANLKALEERVGFVESGVRDALELGKKASSAVAAVATAGSKAPAAIPGTEWWNKRVKSGLQIKSSDGTDVTALIADLVDSATSIRSKDTIAKPDYALHSGGARIIPSLTTPTFEIRPSTLRGQVVGLLTGNGYAIGRPPITALHHEVNNGHCWPFAGSEGQLGVALAAPTYVEEVSVDHVAKELAFDMRSAPREMEVWGMVEGQDNIARVKEWKEHAGGEAIVNAIEYPSTLPKDPEYIRLANFTYDVGSTRSVQTFPVDEGIRSLGVDFGIVVLRVLSNWGQGDFTCLYRFRVHGQRMPDGPPPMNLGEL
jgi:SUN domain-containing protein 1/2